MLPEEPAGLIPTRAPGAVRFEVKLTWRSPEEAVLGSIIPSPLKGVRFFYLDGTNGATGPGETETRCISGEIRAFTEKDLDDALDSVLGSVTSMAALTEAVLEVKTVRVARPRTLSRGAVVGLASEVWGAGFGVRFGPCWTPLWDGVEAAVGIGGLGEAHERMGGLGSWEIVSRPL